MSQHRDEKKEREDRIRENLRKFDAEEVRKAQQELAAYRCRTGKLPYLLWSGD